MGQGSYAVMYGAKVTGKPPKSLGSEGWYEVEASYPRGNGPKAATAWDAKSPTLGFWIAIGNGDERGVPDLKSFPLDDIHSVYATRIKACEEAWENFDAHAKALGVTLDKPRLWLVQTEVG